MDYENPLDHLIHRFQHRWETNPQFRAAMSGVLGLSLIIFLCIGVAGVNAAASRVLGAVGFGSSGGNQGNIDPGGQIVNGNWIFYTPTVQDWKGGGTPGSSPIANSQTPQPSPTPTGTPQDAPTKTPCVSNCGGGGGQTGTLTPSWTPATWSSGMPNGAFTLHATNQSGAPQQGVGLSLLFNWGTTTWLDQNNQRTDANGNYTSHPPSTGTCPNSHQFTVKVQSVWPTHKDDTFSIPCA
jgi:hypothetical protein